MKEIALSHKVGYMWHMNKTLLCFIHVPFKGTIETKGRRHIAYLNSGKERKRISVLKARRWTNPSLIDMRARFI
jgi:hypothetical protein